MRERETREMRDTVSARLNCPIQTLMKATMPKENDMVRELTSN